jgi:hypothetical protein
LRTGVVFEMAFTGGEQGKFTRIPALDLFGAYSGRSQSPFSGFTEIRSRLSLVAPGLQVTKFAGYTLDGVSTVNSKASDPIVALSPPIESVAEVRAGEIDNTLGFGAR